DPASGAALPNYTPISLGYSSYHAFSPDRQTLAVVSFPTETTYHGSLLLIDLPAWKTERFELELTGWVGNMAFSPNGKRLAIAHGESNYKVTMVNIEEGVITAQSQTDSFISRLKFTENGEALMLYRPTFGMMNELNAPPPQVLLLDAADLSPRWSAELEEVHDGIFPKDENVTPADLYEPGQALYISPGLAFAPEQDTLYIVHADAEQLTTVNFGAQKVETVEIQTKLSWFERLLSLTAGVAHAKIADGTHKQVAVSPDGQFLYVTGVNHASFQDQHGNWQLEQTPLGLEIIQTRDGSRVEHLETDATELSLSPDGHFLYLRNWGNNQGNIPSTEIFDTSDWQFVARKDKISATPALLMNGEFLLVSAYASSETSHYMSVLKPDGSSVLAEWKGTEYIYWLSTP
ncbi:MAG: hypothetical protein EHM33_19170, partial [Chloroflexi bacterium]